MVVIHIKKTEAEQFLFECSVADSVDAVTRELVRKEVVASSTKATWNC